MAGTGCAQVSEADCVDHHHGQMRLQVCTLVRVDSAQTETTALFQQVLTMLQQGPVQQRSRSLSIHSQVDTPYPSTTLSTCPPQLPMEAIGATGAIAELAIPVFKCAKEFRDRVKLVRYPLTLRPLVIILSVFAGRIGERGTLDSTRQI